MSHIELASEVGDDFERILDHLAQYQVENPALRIREIIEAINVLEHNPMIGRPANNDKRELVIGRRSMAMWLCTVTLSKSIPFLSLPYAAKKRLATRSFEQQPRQKGLNCPLPLRGTGQMYPRNKNAGITFKIWLPDNG